MVFNNIKKNPKKNSYFGSFLVCGVDILILHVNVRVKVRVWYHIKHEAKEEIHMMFAKSCGGGRSWVEGLKYKTWRMSRSAGCPRNPAESAEPHLKIKEILSILLKIVTILRYTPWFCICLIFFKEIWFLHFKIICKPF